MVVKGKPLTKGEDRRNSVPAKKRALFLIPHSATAEEIWWDATIAKFYSIVSNKEAINC